MTLESDEGLDAGAEATDVSVWVSQRFSASWFPPRRSRGPSSCRALWCILDWTTPGSGVSPEGRKHALPHTHPTRFLRPTGVGEKRLAPSLCRNEAKHYVASLACQFSSPDKELLPPLEAARPFPPPTNFESVDCTRHECSWCAARQCRVASTKTCITTRTSVVLPAPPRRLSTAPVGAEAKLVD